MREQDLRNILLVKAVEESDRDGTLLPAADRAAAGREAMRAMPAAPAGDAATLTARSESLLLARARALMARIAARHPFVPQVVDMLGPSPLLTAGLVAAGLAIGGGLSLLDGTHRINVLVASGLLALVVAWNVAWYVALLAFALRGKAGAAGPFRSWLAATGYGLASRAVARSRTFNAPLAEALHAFVREWYATVKPLLLARTTRGLHLAAAAVGMGLIAGLYLRGIAFDYRAGWESTFLDASQVRALLVALFAPASWLTGIPVPDVVKLEAARWRGNTGGEPAARWIHLMAATALLYVVLPRLALSFLSTARAIRLALRSPLPPGLPAYFRTAFAAVDGAVARARAVVMPYASELPPQALARLIAWIPSAVGGGPVDVEARDPVPYGEEERYLETFAARGAEGADVVVLPFSLAATPEVENHGMVLAGARDHLARARRGARLMVVIDEAPFAARMSGVPERIAERREVWRQFVAAHGLEPAFVSLAP